jgi:hypothetical protein
MKNFLLDLWHDLRAKRLWPVAVVLLAGLVAVPVVLSKKAEAPEVAPPAPTAAKAEAEKPEGPAQLAEVKLEELGQGSGSSLSAFDDPNNPFAPPRKVLEAARRKEEGSPAGQATGSASTGGAPKINSPSIGGDVNVDLGGGSLGGAGGGTVDTGGGDTGGTGGDTGDTGGGDTGETKTTSYTYVVDLTFSANNRRRTIKGMEKLDILPDPASPLLIFLGVTPNAGNAVFLVDSTLDTAGEGTCKPSNSECAFLYLGPGSEHEFTNDEGDSYTLRVDEIRRVKLEKKASASKKDRKTASAAVGQPAPARRFVPPFLADLVSVSSDGPDDSNSDQDRR